MDTGRSGGSGAITGAITSSGHCPHCGVELPDTPPDASAESAAEDPGAVRFCPSCGRRVEGWRTGFRATVGGASAGGALPAGDEATRAIAPSPSLLRAVAASKDAGAKDAKDAGPKDTTSGRAATASDSVPVPAVRPSRAPLVLGVLAAVGAVATLLALRSRPAERLPPIIAENKPVAVSPAPVAGPAPAPKKGGKPHRISAPAIATSNAKGTTVTKTAMSAPVAKILTPKAPGALPHALPHRGGSQKTDSRPTDTAGAASGTGAPPAAGDALPMAANETTSVEAAPMSEADRRAENSARADADGVRFVVQAHLPQVQSCYGRAFKESSPGGRVDIGFTIGPTGKATKVRTENNTTGAPGLGKCLEQRIAEWDFPRPSGGEFELIYPFVFSPGS